jgi:hypothetical protein
MKKCLFTKSTENINTAVTLTTELGPVTVYLSDDVLDKTLKEIAAEVSSLVVQARQLADTFGFDLIEAIGKGGMLSIGEQNAPVQQPVRQEQNSFRRQSIQPTPIQQPTIQQPPRPRSTSAPVTLREQPIPIKNSMQAAMAKRPPNSAARPSKPPQAQIIENEVGGLDLLNGDSPYGDSPYGDAINEGVSESSFVAPVVPNNKKQQLQRVTTPSGVTFEIPSVINDETGTTNITINTKFGSEQLEKRMRQVDQASKQGQIVSTAEYNIKECGFCKGKCNINSKPCPKCNGEGTVMRI